MRLNQSQVADQFGVKQKTISNWESGRNDPSIDVLQKISTKWAISIDRLLGIDVVVGDSFDDSFILIPEYDQQLSAGLGAYPNEQTPKIGFSSFPKVWLNKKGLNKESLKILRVMGESMEPLLRDKDMVMIDTSRTTPTEAIPFAIRLDGELFVKMVQRKGDGNMLLVSKNESYRDIEISSENPPNNFKILGGVVWHSHSWI